MDSTNTSTWSSTKHAEQQGFIGFSIYKAYFLSNNWTSHGDIYDIFKSELKLNHLLLLTASLIKCNCKTRKQPFVINMFYDLNK